jgi:hypothetical protein
MKDDNVKGSNGIVTMYQIKYMTKSNNDVVIHFMNVVDFLLPEVCSILEDKHYTVHIVGTFKRNITC